jgi:hypothetical protein
VFSFFLLLLFHNRLKSAVHRHYRVKDSSFTPFHTAFHMSAYFIVHRKRVKEGE